MRVTVFEGLQSEIYVPITPKSIFTPVTKPLSEMRIALASACGAHVKTDPRFNLAGDTSFREIPDNTPTSELMISHGDMTIRTLTGILTACSPSTDSMSWSKKALLKKRLPSTTVLWAAAEIRKYSTIKRVLKLPKD